MIVSQQQKEKCAEFQQLHHRPGSILVLPNVWDVTSARIFEEAGFAGVATSSGAVAASLGYPDGEKISRQEMLDAVKRITSRVAIPVTADMEAGFGTTEEEIAATTQGVVAAGAMGLNIEDSTRNPQHPLLELEAQLAKIRSVRKVADSLGVKLFINARSDAWMRLAPQSQNKEAVLDTTIERGKEFQKAGADGVYILGLSDPQFIATAVKKLGCPLNIRGGHDAPSIPELQRLGVARVSLATGTFSATLGLLKKIAQELRERGTYEALNEGAVSYQEMNQLALPRKKQGSPS